MPSGWYSDYDSDDISIDYSRPSSEPKAVPKITSTSKSLMQTLGFESIDQWTTWLRSDKVKSWWDELWLSTRTKGERGPGLKVVHKRLSFAEIGGKRMYSKHKDKVRDEWKEADHHACFLYWVRNQNTMANDGVFFNKGWDEARIDQIVWALKKYLRQIHAPSQVGKPCGGASIWGAAEARTMVETLERGIKEVDIEAT